MNDKKPPQPQNPNLSNPTPAPKEGGAPGSVGEREPRLPHDRDGNAAQTPKGPQEPARRERSRQTAPASRIGVTALAVMAGLALQSGCAGGDDDDRPCPECVYPTGGPPAPPGTGTVGAPGAGGANGTGGAGGVGGGGALGGTGGTGGAGGTGGTGGAGGTVGQGGTDPFSVGGTGGTMGSGAFGTVGGTGGDISVGGTGAI